LSANGRRRPLRAVLFDAGNTLVFLDYGRMAQAVGAALRVPLTEADLARHIPHASQAMEQAAGSDQDRAAAYLQALFLRAGIPAERLGEVRECLAGLHRERHLWSSVGPRSAESLARLRAANLKLGIVSNSDGRVEEALEAAGLRQYFDAVIDSALIGVEKPDPRIFQAALAALDVQPDEALYVGDLYQVDVVGARAAGIEAILLGDGLAPEADCRRAHSIEDLVNRIFSGEMLVRPVSDLST
jgi:putative hydrolase of the HAD superfamily